VPLLLQQGLDVFGLPQSQAAFSGGDGQGECAQGECRGSKTGMARMLARPP
jgi:hypothetical protein